MEWLAYGLSFDGCKGRTDLVARAIDDMTAQQHCVAIVSQIASEQINDLSGAYLYGCGIEAMFAAGLRL